MSTERKDIEDSTTLRAIIKVLEKYYDPSTPIEDVAKEIVVALDEAYDEEIKKLFSHLEFEE